MPIYQSITTISFFQYINGTLGLHLSSPCGFAWFGSVERGLSSINVPMSARMWDIIEHRFWTETGPCGAD